MDFARKVEIYVILRIQSMELRGLYDNQTHCVSCLLESATHRGICNILLDFGD